MRKLYKNFIRWLVGVLFAAALVCAGCQSVDMSRYSDSYMSPPRPNLEPSLSITFLGNTNILISDDQTRILIDGYFTRRGLVSSIFKASPDTDTVDSVLALAKIDRLDFVIPLHAHFDHAMDSPYVAEQTGALLIGDENIRQISLGWNESEVRTVRYSELGVVPAQKAKVIDDRYLASRAVCANSDDACYSTGAFDISFFKGKHYVNLTDLEANPLKKAVVPPTPAWKYKRSKSQFILIEHPQGTILILGTAAPIPEKLLKQLKFKNLDVVFLAVPGMHKLETSDKNSLLGVLKSSKLVVPVHWDSLFSYVESGKPPLRLNSPSWFIDTFTKTRKNIDEVCEALEDTNTQFLFMEFGVEYPLSQARSGKGTQDCPE